MNVPDRYRYSHTVGFYSNSGRGFYSPVDMAFGKRGILYVLNRGGPNIASRMVYKRVTMCTLDEEFLGEFGIGGTGDGELMWPAGVAVDGDGNVYVSDEALNRVSIFDEGGAFLGSWGVKGTGRGEFDRPAGIVFDGNGNLLVVDGINNRIQRYTADGDFLGDWGRAGAGAGEFNLPWGICLDDDGNIYVADWRNDRVQKFDAGGLYLATIGASGSGDGQFYRPAGVAVDREGDLYVADWGNERVEVLDLEGRFLARLRGESGLSKWAEDYFVANQDELAERQSGDMEPDLDLWDDDPAGETSASIEKLFWGPTSIKIDGEGRICVVDSCRFRIQVYVKQSVAAAAGPRP